MAVVAETEELWGIYREPNSREARERLILRSAHLVKHVAGRLAVGMSGVLDDEDIIGAGMLGLIKAADDFDPSRGVPFEGYAMTRIKGAILDQLRTMDVLSRSARHRAREIEKAIVEAQTEIARTPTDDEVAARMGLDLDEYQRRLLEARPATVYLESEIPGDGEEDTGTLLSTIVDPNSPDPVSIVEMRTLLEMLTEAVGRLPERDQLLLSLYYREELTMREISRVMDISESRVCQLHTRAVLSLRGYLNRCDAGVVGVAR